MIIIIIIIIYNSCYDFFNSVVWNFHYIEWRIWCPRRIDVFYHILLKKVKNNIVPTIHIGCHLSFPPSQTLPLVTFNHYKYCEKNMYIITCCLSHRITTVIMSQIEYVYLKRKKQFHIILNYTFHFIFT